MFLEAFPNLYLSHSNSNPLNSTNTNTNTIPQTSTLKIKDDYDQTKELQINWSGKKFENNENCQSRVKPRHMVHVTGYHGQNIPTHAQGSYIVNFGPHITDLGFQSGNMFKDSFSLFDRIQEVFEKSINAEGGLHSKQRQSGKNGSSEADPYIKQEVERMKRETAMTHMHLNFEHSLSQHARSKLHSTEFMDVLLLFVIVGLTGWLFYIVIYGDRLN